MLSFIPSVIYVTVPFGQAYQTVVDGFAGTATRTRYPLAQQNDTCSNDIQVQVMLYCSAWPALLATFAFQLHVLLKLRHVTTHALMTFMFKL